MCPSFTDVALNCPLQAVDDHGTFGIKVRAQRRSGKAQRRQTAQRLQPPKGHRIRNCTI